MDTLMLLYLVILILVIVLLSLISNLKKRKQQIESLNEDLSNNIESIEQIKNSHQVALDELNKSNDDSITKLEENIQKIEHKKGEELEKANQRINELETTYSSLLDVDKEINERKLFIEDLKINFEQLNVKYKNALNIHQSLESEIELYKDTLDINSYGLYEPRYSFDLPEQYLVELEGNYTKQKALIKNKTAVICRIEWTVGGSKVEGRKMINQAIKLMLFGFNGECDAVIAKVKWNNVSKAKERIMKSFNEINQLGSVQHIEITNEYLNMKNDELALTYEYEKKKHEQKEEQRLIREQMREEEKVQRESERVQREAEEEARLYNKVLEKAKEELGFATKEEADKLQEKIKALEEKLKAANEKRERAISLAQTTKVGNIYIISNIGSFGDDIYKIGMTRRFDPMDRIKELSDAALPFQFDVHAIIYTENAPQFEKDLHNKFNDKRINKVNSRKEFFNVTLEEIESYVHESKNAEIQFTKMAEAREYRQTLSLLEKMMNKVDTKENLSKYPASLLD